MLEDDSQQPLFAVRDFIRKPYKDGSIYHSIELLGELLIREGDFPDGRDRGLGGRSRWSRVLLSKLVLLQSEHGWSDRDTIEAARTDLKVKACLNLGVDAEPPGQATLSRHRRQMQELGLHEVYQRRFVALVHALGLLSTEEAVLVDSTPVIGAGQQQDTYNLLASAIQQGLSALAEALSATRESVAEHLGLERYLARSIKGSFQADWSTQQGRDAVLEHLVDDVLTIRDALADPANVGWSVSEDQDEGETEQTDNADEPLPRPPDSEPEDGSDGTAGACQQALNLAEDIIEQDIEFDESGAVVGIRHNPGGDRILSTTDPEMRAGRKSSSKKFVGYKLQLVVSAVFGWILDTCLIKGNEHDGERLPEMIRNLDDMGLNPTAWVGDHAYGTIANHMFVRHEWLDETGQPKTELVARMIRPANKGRFSKDDFEYDAQANRLLCPAGDESSPRHAHRHGKRGYLHEFSACTECPLRSQCVSPRAKPTTARSVFVVPDEERVIRQHLDERETARFKDMLKARVSVEHGIQRYVASGGRNARRFGSGNVTFDAAMSALSANIKRLARLLESHDVDDDVLATAREKLDALRRRARHRQRVIFFVLLCRCIASTVLTQHLLLLSARSTLNRPQQF